MNLRKAVGVTFEDGAIDMAKFLHERLDRDGLGVRVILVQADVRDLRIGVGTPRDHEAAGFRAAVEQRILHGDPGIGVGGMRELEA